MDVQYACILKVGQGNAWEIEPFELPAPADKLTPMWLIKRTKPAGEFYGYSIPVFIRNVEYHLATVDAYSDGAIDAWGFLDRDLFAAKLREGWVWPQPPDGKHLSFYNLGRCTSVQGHWTQTTKKVFEEVQSAIRKLNPQMTGLIDMKGSDVELRGNIRYAKLGLSDEKPCRVAAGGPIVLGQEVPAFQAREDGSVLTRVFIFSDGLARVGSDSALVPVEEIFRQFGEGTLTTSVDNGARIQVEGLGSFVCEDGLWPIDARERVRELEAMLAELNGKGDVVALCISAYDDYQKEPSDDKLVALRQSYEAVPEHLQMYCGDMDSKDHPIRRLLFPQEYGPRHQDQRP